MKRIEKDRENNQFLLKGQLSKIISELDSEISRFNQDTLPVLRQKLEEKYVSLTQNRSGGLREKLEQFVFGEIREAFDAWRLQLAEKISTRLEQAHQEFALKINEIIESILALTSSIFELNLKPFTSIDGLSKKSDFFFLLKDDPVGLELVQLAVTSTLPQFFARKMILKNMRTSVNELVRPPLRPGALRSGHSGEQDGCGFSEIIERKNRHDTGRNSGFVSKGHCTAPDGKA